MHSSLSFNMSMWSIYHWGHRQHGCAISWSSWNTSSVSRGTTHCPTVPRRIMKRWSDIPHGPLNTSFKEVSIGHIIINIFFIVWPSTKGMCLGSCDWSTLPWVVALLSLTNSHKFQWAWDLAVLGSIIGSTSCDAHDVDCETGSQIRPCNEFSSGNQATSMAWGGAAIYMCWLVIWPSTQQKSDSYHWQLLVSQWTSRQGHH